MEGNDDVFEALGHERRRRILFALFRDGSTAPGGTGTGGEGGKDDLARYHVHLPKLDDYGFVTWYPDEDRVVRGPRFDEVEPVLELMADSRAELPGSRQ